MLIQAAGSNVSVRDADAPAFPPEPFGFLLEPLKCLARNDQHRDPFSGPEVMDLYPVTFCQNTGTTRCGSVVQAQ